MEAAIKFINISDVYAKGINTTWNLELPADFCEGKIIPYFVPGVYEIFSSVTGGFLVLVGFIGLLQPRLEMLMKIMYAGLAVSGVGTVLLHYKRILLYNFADLYPMFFTVALGMIAFFDELIFEFRRPRDAEDKVLDYDRHALNEKTNFCRALLDAIAYTLIIVYLVVGFILCIFSSEFSFDIVGYYFAIPFVSTAIGGMIYLTTFKPYRNPLSKKQLSEVRNVAIGTGLLSIVFKVIDAFACSNITVWLFPHPLFHLLTTYATHCFIVFIAYYRSNNTLKEDEQDRGPVIYWFLKFYPHIFIPDYNDPEATATGGMAAAAAVASDATVLPRSPDVKGNTKARLETPMSTGHRTTVSTIIGPSESFSLNQ